MATGWRRAAQRRWLAGLIAVGLWVAPVRLSAETAYDCLAAENRDEPTTVEVVVLKKKWKDHVDEIEQALTPPVGDVKVRVKLYPFVAPPKNIGIGKCVSADTARLALREAIRLTGGIDRLIRQDILPHHWVKIGSTDTAELAWIPVMPEDVTRLMDPALSTDQFHALYRELATPKSKPLPFGMGSLKRDE